VPAAFTELNVRLRVQDAAAPKTPSVFGAFAHDLAAIQDNRAKTHLRKDQPREQATWASPDHDWPGRARSRRGYVAVAGIGRSLEITILAVPGEHLRFIA
jgi:hypothetical protein